MDEKRGAGHKGYDRMEEEERRKRFRFPTFLLPMAPRACAIGLQEMSGRDESGFFLSWDSAECSVRMCGVSWRARPGYDKSRNEMAAFSKFCD